MLDRQRIKERRELSGLSQERLGSLIGKDGPYIWKLEHGVRQTITTDTLEQLATHLDCSTDYLLGRVEDPRPSTGKLSTPVTVG